MTLTVRTVRLDLDAAAKLLDLVPADRPVTWLRNGDGLVGWGVAAEVRTHGDTRFADAAKWWSELTARTDVHDEVNEPGTGMVSFGSFAFGDDPGDSVLVLPQVVVGRRGDLAWITTVGDIGAVPAPVEAPAVSTAQAHTQAARLLGLAQETADRLTEEAKTEADRLLAEAKNNSEALVTDATTRAEATERDSKVRAEALDAQAKARYDEVIGNLATERVGLEKKIDDLRRYEKEYRGRLKSWISEQLSQLDDNSSREQVAVTAGPESVPTS